MPQADLSVWVGVIAPALPVLGLCQREGTPLGRVSDAACRKRAAYSRSAWSSEAPIPLPGNSPAMVPAAVAAIPCLLLPAVDLGTPPRRCRRALCAGHPLHPMTAGHATDPKQGRDCRYRRPDRHCLRIGYSRSPGGAAKAVLSPSSPPPERPRPHSLAGAPGSGGGSAPVVQLSACGPLPGSTPGSTEAQVLTFGMSSQRVV